MPIIDVLYASTDPQLTTTGYVKSLMGTTSTADDATLDTLITAASKWAESFVGYGLSAQRYLELAPGYGSRRLMLSQMPLRAIPNGPFTASDTGEAIEIDSTTIRVNRAAGLLDRNEGWAWTAPLVPRPFGFGLTETQWSGQEEPLFLVDFVAGYTYGGVSTGSNLWSTRLGTTSTGRTLPQDIEDGVALKVIEMFDGVEGVLEKQVGDLRVRFASLGRERDANNMLTPAEKRLAPYRRMA